MGQVELIDVTKSFGEVKVINETNLDIQNGEFVIFVGPSGCGKSTMLRMIAGLESVSSGDIKIDDVVVNNLPPVERGISMVFQSYALYPHMSVYENIAFPLRVAKMEKSELDKRVMNAARILKLEDRLGNKPGELSGGQRQRVAIGRSIVREPKVFLFDEPLSNLDAALRSDMRVELSSLHKELKNTMIYVTHDQVEAMTMANKIVVLNGGYISQVGSPLDLYHKPANKFVAGFIGNPSMNFLKCKFVKASKSGVTIEFMGKEISLPLDAPDVKAGDEVELGIRPDEVILGEKFGAFEVTPAVVEYLGSITVIYADHESADDRIRLVLLGTQSIVEGQPISVGLNAEDCHLFASDGEAFPRRVDISKFRELPDSYKKS